MCRIYLVFQPSLFNLNFRFLFFPVFSDTSCLRRQLARNMLKHQPKLYPWKKYPHPLMEVGDGWFVWPHSCVTWFWMALPTGCSLSDQYIFWPLKPKYNNWFTKIYKKCFEIQNTSFASFEFQNNLCKSL